MTNRKDTRRVFGIADLHVDHLENLYAVKAWSAADYGQDALVVAGDVTDDVSLLKDVLSFFKQTFHEVFFVPGNHDLWVRNDEDVPNSLRKFYKLRALCDSLGVRTKPTKFLTTCDNGNGYIWIVPLFSWYTTPDEDISDSLYITNPDSREDLSKVDLLWMDNHNCVWPSMFDSYPAAYFCDMNDDIIQSISFDSHPIISFSHFMPRSDLIIPDDSESACHRTERSKRHLCPDLPPNQGAPEFFNFSRFAGCKRLDKQIRMIDSTVHFYGHQHRNRDRVIDNIRYISHSMGYQKERDNGYIMGLAGDLGPKQIWPIPPLLTDS